MAMSAVVWIGVAAAAEPPLPAADLRAGERARVAAVVDGDTVVLTTGRRDGPAVAFGLCHFTASAIPVS